LLEEAIGAITMGSLINIDDASGSANSVCIGDFRDIGWSRRVATRSSLYYDWNGPNAIRVGGTVVEPGSSTPEYEMDWS
jgi:hypothetical protein